MDKSLIESEQDSRNIQNARINFIKCQSRIKEIKTLQDLIRHKTDTQTNLARPIQDIIKMDIEKITEYTIDQKISKLLPVIDSYLRDIGIHSYLKTSDGEYELILAYLDLPRNQMIDHFTMVMRELDTAIGAYEHIAWKSKLDCINPVSIAAWILKIPFDVFSKAGFPIDQKIYAWFIRIVLGIILVLIMTRLGISIKDVISLCK